MQKKVQSSKLKELRKENTRLKEELAILSNVNIIKKLNRALDDIKEGKFTIRA